MMSGHGLGMLRCSCFCCRPCTTAGTVCCSVVDREMTCCCREEHHNALYHALYHAAPSNDILGHINIAHTTQHSRRLSNHSSSLTCNHCTRLSNSGFVHHPRTCHKNIRHCSCSCHHNRSCRWSTCTSYCRLIGNYKLQLNAGISLMCWYEPADITCIQRHGSSKSQLGWATYYAVCRNLTSRVRADNNVHLKATRQHKRNYVLRA